MAADRHTAPSYQPRTYRRFATPQGLVAFTVRVAQSDLAIHADADLSDEALEALVQCRGQLEAYIAQHPDVATTLTPWPDDPLAPAMVQEMIAAGRSAGVGPMAAVAGAVAQHVGRQLRRHSRQVVVENGGDIYLDVVRPMTVALWAGRSPLSMKVGLRLEADPMPVGVCTSSGTIGHSLSMGKADAVCVVAPSCPLADAAATAIGNRVRGRSDIEPALAFARSIKGVQAVVIVTGRHMGAWGQVALVPLDAQAGAAATHRKKG